MLFQSKELCFRSLGGEWEGFGQPKPGYCYQFFSPFELLFWSEVSKGNTENRDDFLNLNLKGAETVADLLQRAFAKYGDQSG